MRSTRFRLHVGIEGETGKGDGKGTRGGESGCMSPRWVGSDAFLLVLFPLIFLSLRGQLDRDPDPGARQVNNTQSLFLSLFKKSHSIAPILLACVVVLLITPPTTTKGRRLTTLNNLIS